MNTAIQQMLANYPTNTLTQRKNALKEIIQEIVLCGLSRANFFDECAFYGGTALRIFYQLDRFSEDLDFSLTSPNPDFDISAFFPTLEKEVRSFGLQVDIAEKKKTKETAIESAFLKGNTREHLLLFYPDKGISGVAHDEVIKIKFEVDTNPPEFAGFERKYRLLPSPYEVRLYDEPSLFAGKIHAVLYRGWKNRVKGRDLYDYLFYLSRASKVNLPHLRSRLLQTGTIAENELTDIAELKALLCTRFDTLDYELAKQDVEPFLTDASSLSLWSADFFKQVTEGLR